MQIETYGKTTQYKDGNFEITAYRDYDLLKEVPTIDIRGRSQHFKTVEELKQYIDQLQTVYNDLSKKV